MTSLSGGIRHILHTGQSRCYDSRGSERECRGSGEDAEFHIGAPWPEPRFRLQEDTVLDLLTGLTWTRDANINVFPCAWQEACSLIADLNRSGYGGFSDWRLPNRNELRSLISYQTRKPALPPDPPFDNVYLGWYWTSTTAAIHPRYAWSVHMEGARMFYGRKEQYQLFWPVRGQGNGLLPATGQEDCFAADGRPGKCLDDCQDGAQAHGAAWPTPRFIEEGDIVRDRLTGLVWLRRADLLGRISSWQEALDAVQAANREELATISTWRLPNINELASLVDCSSHTPALSRDHPFIRVRDGYWSATTSYFEPDWAWVLYLDKGACGVGHKPGTTFHAWPTAGPLI